MSKIRKAGPHGVAVLRPFIKLLDSIIPNSLSTSIPGFDQFEIVKISSGEVISYPSSFDLGAIVALSINNFTCISGIPFFFQKPDSTFTITFPVAAYGSYTTPNAYDIQITSSNINSTRSIYIVSIFYRLKA